MTILGYLKRVFKREVPKANVENIKLEEEEPDEEIKNEIESINWKEFETAYGNAEKSIPKYLKELYSSNERISYQATHELWCSLCHQHAYISSASIPAYEFLKKRLINGSEKLQIELLDIFYGFAVCSLRKEFDESEIDFIHAMRKKILDDEVLFKTFIESKNEDIKGFAESIIEEIDEGKNS